MAGAVSCCTLLRQAIFLNFHIFSLIRLIIKNLNTNWLNQLAFNLKLWVGITFQTNKLGSCYLIIGDDHEVQGQSSFENWKRIIYNFDCTF